MNKIITISLLLLGLLFNSVAGYSAPANLDGIGIIDVRFAIFKTEKAQRISTKLSKKSESKINQLGELEKYIRKTEKTLIREKVTLSPTKQKELLTSLQKKSAQYQQLRAFLEREKSTAEQQLLNSYKEALAYAVKKIVKKEKISLLLNREAISYLDPSLIKKDITIQLIKELNQWDKTH